ncbi:hypothetical protein BESB_081670 [Besnoitia besnoiti]|uniref:SRS domain-containing protein n=1 Tax=Besnoitia besnoiti TaxID=94643 RepID=A0A2A9M3A1_BESBE|nr:hypothetical protein BESB_081670 [Besnoitia besnoiti]PFH32968.1 hypothetical protein BESB_081670 [Besnoitia besnoiti]
MKLPIASLGAAAAALLSLQAASATPTSTGAPTDTGSSNLLKDVAICSSGQLKLSVSAPNGAAAFRCSADFPDLSPDFATSAQEQKVLLGGQEKLLREIVSGATLEQKKVPLTGANPATKEQDQSPTTNENVYVLTVPKLPPETTAVTLKCIKKSGGPQALASTTGSCEVLITVASSASSAALQPALAAVVGLLSLGTTAVLQLAA